MANTAIYTRERLYVDGRVELMAQPLAGHPDVLKENLVALEQELAVLGLAENLTGRGPVIVEVRDIDPEIAESINAHSPLLPINWPKHN